MPGCRRSDRQRRRDRRLTVRSPTSRPTTSRRWPEGSDTRCSTCSKSPAGSGHAPVRLRGSLQATTPPRLTSRTRTESRRRQQRRTDRAVTVEGPARHRTHVLGCRAAGRRSAVRHGMIGPDGVIFLLSAMRDNTYCASRPAQPVTTTGRKGIPRRGFQSDVQGVNDSGPRSRRVPEFGVRLRSRGVLGNGSVRLRGRRSQRVDFTNAVQASGFSRGLATTARQNDIEMDEGFKFAVAGARKPRRAKKSDDAAARESRDRRRCSLGGYQRKETSCRARPRASQRPAAGQCTTPGELASPERLGCTVRRQGRE